jgi:hypothetical protein
MKKKSTTKPSRRSFLSLGLLGGAGLLTSKAEAMIPDMEDDQEKVQMLTPDGKLVEVSKRVLEQSSDRQKANNKDILDWSQTAKKS